MKKRTEVDGDHHPLSTSTPKEKKEHGDLSLVEEFNLTGGVRNALSKSKVEEQVAFLWSTSLLIFHRVDIQLHKRKL